MLRDSKEKVETPSWADLVERIQAYHPGAEKALFERLYQRLCSLAQPQDIRLTAEKKSGAEKAAELSFSPLDVATILVDLRMDTASLAAGLLLEGVNSQRISLTEVRSEFGEDVAFLVEGVTKISLLSSRAKSESQAEDFRKMILAMARDIRVVLVRLAICLHHLRKAVAADVCPLPRPPREIFEIYAPIAHRLGIYWIKNEMEDLAFSLSQPEVYQSLCEQVAQYRKGGADAVRKMVILLTKLLRKHNISGQVLGREKHIYSIHNKLQLKGGSLDALYDVVGYRIIVRKKSDCYRALGMIHGEFRPIPGRMKDYIALPKSNGYQSLHSVVFGPFGYRVEIQIRTRKMHQVAESGVAAHWSYKEGLHTKKSSAATGYDWLKRMVETHQNTDNPAQFVENVKIDLFPHEIYLFSPAGDIITLPAGATAVDFAYGVHSEVGDHCQGAKVNGRIVPLKTILKTGDVVEILTNRNQHPSLDWLRFVVTSQARYRINRWEKNRTRNHSIALGRELLSREFQRVGQSSLFNDKLLHKAIEIFKVSQVDELLFRIGSSVLSPTVVLHRLFPEWDKGERPAVDKSHLEVSPQQTMERASSNLRLGGVLAEMSVMAARCCRPVPGDITVGIVTTGKGITLHARECPNLEKLKDTPERWIESIDWPEDSSQHYVARLRIWASNRRSTPTRITQAVTGNKANIVSMQIQERDRDPYILFLDVEVTGISLLERVMQGLRTTAEVMDVERMRG